MVDFNKLKALGTEFLGRAGELAEQAKEKAGPLAEQAKEKAGPLAEKAKEAAVKGTHKAAETLDTRTGGKYSEKIDSVTGKVDTALRKDPAAGAATGAAASGAADAWPAATSGFADAAPHVSDPAPTTFETPTVGGDHVSDAAWTTPAAGTETDAAGLPADPGWGEDATATGDPDRPAGF